MHNRLLPRHKQLLVHQQNIQNQQLLPLLPVLSIPLPLALLPLATDPVIWEWVHLVRALL